MIAGPCRAVAGHRKLQPNSAGDRQRIDIDAVLCRVLCHTMQMVDTSYQVVAGADGSFDVQMSKPNGHSKTAAGFGSEHEANAWIVQAKRMKRDAAPWTPLVPRKPGADAAIRSANARAAREPSIEKP